MQSTEIVGQLTPLRDWRSSLDTRLATITSKIADRERRRVDQTVAGGPAPSAKANDEIRTLRDEQAATTGAIEQLSSEIGALEVALQESSRNEAIAASRERLDVSTAAARLANANRRERLRQFMSELHILETASATAQDEGRAAAAALAQITGNPCGFQVDRYADAPEANFVQTLLGYGAAEWLRVSR